MKRPTFLQALAITLCGAVMFFFGCLGALSGMERPPSLIPLLGVGGMYVGGAAVVIGIFLALLATVIAFVGLFIRARESEESTEKGPGEPR